VEKFFDATKTRRPRANGLHQSCRAGIDAGFGGLVAGSARKKPRRQIVIGRRERRLKDRQAGNSLAHSTNLCPPAKREKDQVARAM
jgi:hypothetical protein